MVFFLENKYAASEKFMVMLCIFLMLALIEALEFSAVANSASLKGIHGTVKINSVPVSGAVVYLRNQSGRKLPLKPMKLTIMQQEFKFKPLFGVVTAGSTLRFENHDDEIHNVKSDSLGNRFDVGAHMPGTIKEVVLKKSGAVVLRCRVHHEMRGIIFVSPSVHFAVTDEEGRFTIPDARAGSYKIEAWHPRLTSDEIESGGSRLLVDSGDTEIDLDLKAKAPSGADLTEFTGQDWNKVIEEINSALDLAVNRWKAGKRSSALVKVMTTHSRLYGESGLREAIARQLGKGRAAEHDNRFNELVKQVQNERPGEASKDQMLESKKILLEGLRKDAGKLL